MSRLTNKMLRSYSNKQLSDDLAYTTKTGDHYPKSYLEQVQREIKRRETKGAK